MSTTVSSDGATDRTLDKVLVHHNENEIDLLNGQDRFVAKCMLNFPPLEITKRRIHADGMTEVEHFPKNTDPITFDGYIDRGQHLFEQLTQSKRKQDRLLVPDLATEWFRKQKIFLDKTTSKKLHLKKGTCNTPKSILLEQLLSNCQKRSCLESTNQSNDEHLPRQELKIKKLCQSKLICCTQVPSNKLEPIRKRSVKLLYSKEDHNQNSKEQKQQSQKSTNVKRDPISIWKSEVSYSRDIIKSLLPTERINSISLSRKKHRITGVSCLKLPLRRRCPCRQTWRQRNSYSCMFQADGQPMSGDCMAERRTEPLMPRLRKKNDIRKAPQRRLDPTHFRRISPEFYNLLKRYEDGMTQRYPLYGISMRYWSEAKPFCPCEKRAEQPEDKCLGDEAIESPPDNLKSQAMNAASSKNDDPSGRAESDPGTHQVITTTIDSSTKVQIPCTKHTCPALKPLPPTPIKCQYCNTCYLYPITKEENKPNSKKSYNPICGCFRPCQSPENKIKIKDLKNYRSASYKPSKHSDIPRCVATSVPTHGNTLPSFVTHYHLPPYQSFSTGNRGSDSRTSASQAAISAENPSLPASRSKHTSLFSDFACLCKRAILPGRHLLYNFNTKYRQHREAYFDQQTSKPMMTKQLSKHQNIHNGPPNLFQTHPAPCCWHLRERSDVSNSNTTLKANNSSQNAVNSRRLIVESCLQTEFSGIGHKSPECIFSCARITESPENASVQDTPTKIMIESSCICKQSNTRIIANVSQECGQQDLQSEAVFNSESCHIIKSCDHIDKNPRIKPVNHTVCSTNDNCIHSNAKDIVNKSFECDCYLPYSNNKPKIKEKKPPSADSACGVRKISCTRACFLASDYLQLMRRVARKRASKVSPNRKSMRLKGCSRVATPLDIAQNMVPCLQSRANSTSERKFKSNVCRSRKPSPCCHSQQIQMKSTANTIPDRLKDYQKNRELISNRSTMQTKDVSSNLYLDKHNSSMQTRCRGLKQDRNLLSSKYWPSCWTDESCSSDSHSVDRSESGDSLNQTSSSYNHNGSIRLCCCEKTSNSSYGQTWYPLIQQKKHENLHYASSTSLLSHIQSICSVNNTKEKKTYGMSDKKAKISYDTTTIKSKMDDNFTKFDKRKTSSTDKHCTCLQHKIKQSGIRINDHKEIFAPTPNEYCGCSGAKRFRYGHQSTSSMQRCNWENTQLINVHSKTSAGQKQTRFSVGFEHSASLRRSLRLNSNSIFGPCVPNAFVANILPHASDKDYKTCPASKNNFRAPDSIQYTNECCNPVSCYYWKAEHLGEQQQHTYTKASSHRLQKCPSCDKLLFEKPTINEQFIRHGLSLEKKPKHHYNHNHAHLLLCTRRPPPPQAKSASSHYRPQQIWGFKKRPIWQSLHHNSDDDYKIVDKGTSKKLSMTQRPNSGSEVPFQKTAREQDVLSTNKQHPYQCNPCDNTGKNTGVNFSLKQLAKTDIHNYHNKVNEDFFQNQSFSQSTPTDDVNDKIYMEKNVRNNAINGHSLLIPSQLVASTKKHNRSFAELISSPVLSQRPCNNRNFLRPAAIVSDLEFYTHLEKIQPTTPSFQIQAGSLAYTCDNSSFKNTPVLPHPTTSICRPQTNTSSTGFINRQRSSAYRRNYSSSSDKKCSTS